MYAFLMKYMPALAAEIILVIWYTALILAVILNWDLPQAEFRYGNM
jgi:hypothetical protein